VAEIRGRPPRRQTRTTPSQSEAPSTRWQCQQFTPVPPSYNDVDSENLQEYRLLEHPNSVRATFTPMWRAPIPQHLVVRAYGVDSQPDAIQHTAVTGNVGPGAECRT
jgi:hypothetical protein